MSTDGVADSVADEKSGWLPRLTPHAHPRASSVAAMSSDTSSKTKAAPGKKLTQEQILAGFNQLRQEQRALASKIVEVEADVNEHT